jgi:hypothetical protein
MLWNVLRYFEGLGLRAQPPNAYELEQRRANARIAAHRLRMLQFLPYAEWVKRKHWRKHLKRQYKHTPTEVSLRLQIMQQLSLSMKRRSVFAFPKTRPLVARMMMREVNRNIQRLKAT